ncbi:MAG: hydrogenase maturation peptidase HycI [DPANN group archaeon]|nr:hydrogenase maturation peptidase HycI [DPANN group archaeon]
MVLNNISKNVVICGIGNTMRGDDSIGPYVLDLLRYDNVNAHLIECGLAPENFVGKIISFEPKKIILVDAADFKGLPGEIKIIKRNEIRDISLSTHKLPLELFIKYLENNSEAEIIFIGIKPKRIGFHDKLSVECESSAVKVKDMINYILIQNK